MSDTDTPKRVTPLNQRIRELLADENSTDVERVVRLCCEGRAGSMLALLADPPSAGSAGGHLSGTITLDDERHIVTAYGLRIHADLFRHLAVPTPDGGWFRVISVEDGVATVQERTDLIAASETQRKECKWQPDEDGVYHTGCGHEFFFDSGTATENGAKFCLYCGNDTKEVPYAERHTRRTIVGKLLTPQPALFHAPIKKDVVYTPAWLAELVVQHFKPNGRCLDPCRGDGAFYRLLPDGAEWCEMAEGRDFFAWWNDVDWVIGNPPYSCLLGWIRHSFKVAENVVYLMPLHRVFASYEFMADVQRYGGIPEILLIGTGATAGFPFGHALGAVHYRREYRGGTRWSYRDPSHTGDVGGPIHS